MYPIYMQALLHLMQMCHQPFVNGLDNYYYQQRFCIRQSSAGTIFSLGGQT